MIIYVYHYYYYLFKFINKFIEGKKTQFLKSVMEQRQIAVVKIS